MSASGNEPDELPKLPEKRLRSRRGESEPAIISVKLQTVTPILGGGPVTRQIDKVDVIRVPAIRGQLRFWWRALYGHTLPDAAALYKAESGLFGRAVHRDEVREHGIGTDGPKEWQESQTHGRSPVEISVQVIPGQNLNARIDDSDPDPETLEGYVLWAARATEEERRLGKKGAQRYKAPIGFDLTLSVPPQHKAVLENVVRAWVLFGGYGARTRRGLGSLTVRGDDKKRAHWLPSDDGDDDHCETVSESLEALFRANIFGRLEAPLIPQFGGATLLVGPLCGPPTRVGQRGDPGQQAWRVSICWLRDFRRNLAPAETKGRGAGAALYPAIQRLSPRAEIGLPIVGPKNTPFQLVWKQGAEQRDRLASPLIIKPLPTMGGFRPCALWLARPRPNGVLMVSGGSDLRPLDDGLAIRNQLVQVLTVAPRNGTAKAIKITP